MGSRVSHMNIFAINTIVQCNRLQYENILRSIEGRKLLLEKRLNIIAKNTKDINDNDDDDYYDEKKNEQKINDSNNNINNNDDIINDNYMISSLKLEEILQNLEIDAADIYLLQNLFTLADKRGYDSVDLKDLLTLFTIVFSSSVEDCLRLAMTIHDRQSLQIIEKTKLLHIFTLLNESCCYFGDMFLTKAQLQDLTDSIYTNAGKIDGDIVYMDFLHFMAEHPIIEMLLSPQFQGQLNVKYLDDKSFSNTEIVVDI